MLVTLKFRERLRAVAQVIVDELEQVVASITTGWRVEHHDDGTHGAITAESVTSSGVMTASAGSTASHGVTVGTVSGLYGGSIRRYNAKVVLIGVPGQTDITEYVAITKSDGASIVEFHGDGTVLFNGAVTTDGGLQTFGANDSAGAGYRLVRVPNI